jgi:hypothetical protein
MTNRTTTIHPDSRSTTPSDHPLDGALLLNALRGLIRTWRERAVEAPPEIATVYERVENDLAGAIASQTDRQATWAAARNDIAAAVVAALRSEPSRNSA